MNNKPADARFVIGLLKDTFNDWMEDGVLRLSAALAYYSIFSIAPLLVITISLAGLAGSILGPENVNQQIYEELGGMIGKQSVELLQSMVASASKPATSKVATVVGVLTLLIGASSVFGQLKDALNTIWEVKAKSGLGIKGFLRERFLSFGMVLVIGFLLLTSLVLTAAVAGFSHLLETVLPMPAFVWGVIGFFISFGVVTVLFALIFKVLPDVTVEWRHVWVGAIVTALLFEIGKFLLGFYLGRESTASSYGAAGAVVLLLLWVYYASCILFFGAEFTQVYARATGAEIRPTAIAEPVTGEMRAQQGMAPSSGSHAEAPREKIVPIPVYAPPPVVPLPKSMSEVPEYLRQSPAASILAALGGGFVLSLFARFAQRPPKPRTPVQEISHGVRTLAIGAAALAIANAARGWSETKTRLDPAPLAKTAQRLAPLVTPAIRRVFESLRKRWS